MRGSLLAHTVMKLRSVEVLLGLTLVISAPAWAADDLAAVVKKTLEAYGGEAALAKVVAVRSTGKVASEMRKGAQGTMVRTFARPRRLRVELGYPNEAAEVRVLDGARGWRHGAEVKGPPLDAMVLQAARLGLPLLLAEKRAQLRDGGVVERDGVKLRAIEVPLDGAMTVIALVEPSTGHILHSLGKAPGPQMPIEFGSSYGDFRRVQGVLVPFQERTVAMGTFTGETTLEKVEFLTAAPLEAFVP